MIRKRSTKTRCPPTEPIAKVALLLRGDGFRKRLARLGVTGEVVGAELEAHAARIGEDPLEGLRLHLHLLERHLLLR